MKKDYIDKLERVLYFVSTFPEMQTEQSNSTLYCSICMNLQIEIPNCYNWGTTILKSRHDRVLTTYPNKIVDNEVCNTFYYRSNYQENLIFNPHSQYLEYNQSGKHEINIEIPEYDINSESGEFQFSLLHGDEILGIMQIVQYFKRKGHHAFSINMHQEFDKIYEELDEYYNIGREGYLLGN